MYVSTGLWFYTLPDSWSWLNLPPCYPLLAQTSTIEEGSSLPSTTLALQSGISVPAVSLSTIWRYTNVSANHWIFTKMCFNLKHVRRYELQRKFNELNIINMNFKFRTQYFRTQYFIHHMQYKAIGFQSVALYISYNFVIL